MSFSSSGAPVTSVSPPVISPSLQPPSVSQVVPSGSLSPCFTVCGVQASLTAMAPAPSSSMSALPVRRTIIWAWSLSKNEDRSGLRMLPSLSRSKMSTQSGLSSVRWSAVESRNGSRRSAVLPKSSSRALAPAEPGSSAFCASVSAVLAIDWSGLKALASVGSSGVRDKRLALYSRVSSGVRTASTCGFFSISALACWITNWFSGVASPVTGTLSPPAAPSSIVKSTIMIWPPNSFWYATLSLATWSLLFR